MNIDIQQPQPFDLVGSTILIAGNAVGFEATLSLTVSDGHDEFTGIAMAGSTSLRQFQASLAIPPNPAFQLDRLFLTVADDTGGGDGVPPPSVTVPILFGPRILPGYTGYWIHVVVRGDTLSALADRFYGDPNGWEPIRRANPNLISDPNLIFPGQVFRIPRND
ncbi:MAG: Gmad2 immunoglobulin-like domain-containing protein [Pseudomonadota bacterium]